MTKHQCEWCGKKFDRDQQSFCPHCYHWAGPTEEAGSAETTTRCS